MPTVQQYRNKFGVLHREDGPAIIHPDGYKAWYRYGKRHREDGPAVEHPNGEKQWWLKDERFY